MFSASNSSHPMQVDPSGSEADRVAINVGGMRYETCKSSLLSIPGTRLANLVSDSSGGDPKHTTSEFFFDRDSGAFAPILNYYRTGKLHCPPDVCGPLFKEELTFWGISENDLELCCRANLRQQLDVAEMLAKLEPDDEPPDYSTVAGGSGRVQTSSGVCKPKLWALFDDPNSSVAATIIGIISLLFILLSIIVFCLGTSNSLQVSEPDFNYQHEAYDNSSDVFDHDTTTMYSIGLFWVENVCSLWFTIEFLIRIISCPNKCKFILNVMTIVDILGFLLQYLRIVFYYRFLELLYVARCIRLLRVFKIVGPKPGIRALGLSLRASICDFIQLALGLCVALLVFSILALYAEHSEPHSAFSSIFSALWWAVITMTTVGYGDVFPVTWFGKVVASLCALTGVLAIAMPIPILVTRFTKYYALTEAKQRRLPKTRREAGHAPGPSAPDTIGLENGH